jgi:hypothetical protein
MSSRGMLVMSLNRLNRYELVNDPFLCNIANDIVSLYNEMGSPDQSHYERKETKDAPFVPFSVSEMGDWSGLEDLACESINDAISSLFEMIGYRKLENGKWVCASGMSGEYFLFVCAAMKIINDWLDFDALDEFCDNDPYAIETDEIPFDC